MGTDTFSPQARQEFTGILTEFIQQLHDRGVRFSVDVDGQGHVDLPPAEVLAYAENPQAWLRQLQGK